MKKIIAVDDSKVILGQISGFMQIYKDYELITSSKPKEALTLIEDNLEDIELIFLDHNMPEMTGLELLDHIKDKFPPKRVIVLTANVQPAIVKKIRDFGASFLAKPISQEIFDSVIRKIAKLAA